MGPKISSGPGSKQDYSTPSDFLGAVERRFGIIQFDLAAHAVNKRHERYLAPKMLTRKNLDLRTVCSDLSSRLSLVDSLVREGGRRSEVEEVIDAAVHDASHRLAGYELGSHRSEKKLRELAEVDLKFQNRDEKAYGFDSLEHSWAELAVRYGGPLWLNCEFSDIEPWKKKCRLEMGEGASVLSLTPAVITNWFRDLCAGTADVYLLSGRLCFDGKNVFPKDCMLSHFHPEARGALFVWDWKRDVLTTRWELRGVSGESLRGVVDDSGVSGVPEGVAGERPI